MVHRTGEGAADCAARSHRLLHLLLWPLLLSLALLSFVLFSLVLLRPGPLLLSLMIKSSFIFISPVSSSPFSVSSLTCNFPPSQSQPVRSLTFLSNRPGRQQMNQLSFSSSLYILPSQSQLVVTSSLTLLSGRQQMNHQHRPGGRATSGGDWDPFFPLSFPSFESPKSLCNSIL